MIEGYFAIALTMPAWRPILGGLIGFAGICLEFPGLMTIYPLAEQRCMKTETKTRRSNCYTIFQEIRTRRLF